MTIAAVAAAKEKQKVLVLVPPLDDMAALSLPRVVEAASGALGRTITLQDITLTVAEVLVPARAVIAGSGAGTARTIERADKRGEQHQQHQHQHQHQQQHQQHQRVPFGKEATVIKSVCKTTLDMGGAAKPNQAPGERGPLQPNALPARKPRAAKQAALAAIAAQEQSAADEDSSGDDGEYQPSGSGSEDENENDSDFTDVTNEDDEEENGNDGHGKSPTTKSMAKPFKAKDKAQFSPGSEVAAVIDHDQLESTRAQLSPTAPPKAKSKSASRVTSPLPTPMAASPKTKTKGSTTATATGAVGSTAPAAAPTAFPFRRPRSASHPTSPSAATTTTTATVSTPPSAAATAAATAPSTAVTHTAQRLPAASPYKVFLGNIRPTCSVQTLSDLALTRGLPLLQLDYRPQYERNPGRGAFFWFPNDSDARAFADAIRRADVEGKLAEAGVSVEGMRVWVKYDGPSVVEWTRAKNFLGVSTPAVRAGRA